MKKYTKHPCVTHESDGGLYLNIFAGMFHEESLPKWTKIKADKAKEPGMDEVGKSSIGSSNAPSGVFESVASIGRVSESTPWHYDRLMSASTIASRQKPKGALKRLSLKFRRGQSVEKTMAEAKAALKIPNGTKDLEDAAKAATTLHKVLLKSGQMGQAAKVRDYIQVLMYEVALVKAGYDKYLVEDDVIKFVLKSEKGVYIDFLRNYSEILPLEVAEKKIEVDKLMVFDNYAVLFYSPAVDPFREIVHREERRKILDPILFGLIEGSRKLYYITDWTFKDDDLTLEKLETAIGQKAHSVADSEFAGGFSIAKLNANLVNYDRLINNGVEKK